MPEIAPPRVRVALLSLAGAAILALALAGPPRAAAGAAPADWLAPVAPGVYAHVGQVALTTPENAGDIANLGVIVGDDAVAVVDTGGSVAVGRRLREEIRRLTGKPVRYVINTHEHPDHVFGNAAFAGATFVGHRALPEALAARGEHYLRSFVPQLGEAAIAEVQLIPPTVLVADTLDLDLGHRVLRLTAWTPAAHTNCDLTVLDESSGTLFAGDLLFLRHVPIVDGSVKGWLALLPRLAQVPALRAVPGHGPIAAAWPDALGDERRYLETLARDTRAEIAAGTRLDRAVPRIGASERGAWELFDAYNPRNATAAFGEFEWE